MPQEKSLSFRSPTPGDYLFSSLRRDVFASFSDDRQRIDLDRLVSTTTGDGVGELLRRGTASERLGNLQRGGALETWRAMRNILPVEVWNRFD